METRTGAPGDTLYRCAVYLAPDDAGGYSVTVPLLPGAASGGANEKEALANITEALEGVIGVYKEDGGTIPWKTGELPIPDPGTLIRWVFIHC